MFLNGAQIYCDSVELDQRSQEQIERIVSAIKDVSPRAQVSFRFTKDGHIFEGLLWGRAIDSPLGIYSRGTSLDRLLETLQKKVSFECLKIWKKKGKTLDPKIPSPRRSVQAEAA